MEKDTLFETLKSNAMSFTPAEIEQIMNEELGKAPEEMDTELVDLCAEVLHEVYFKGSRAESEKSAGQEKGAKSKKIKFGKFVFIAAALAIIFGVTICAGAKYVHIEAAENIVEFVKDHFKINLQHAEREADTYSDESADLVQTLRENGFEEVILPAELLKDTYAVQLTNVSDDENFADIHIDFENNENNVSGYITIVKYKNEAAAVGIGQGDMSQSYDRVKQLTLNGMDVFVFGKNDGEHAFIMYIDGYTEYTISLNCSFDEAVDIAQTLE